MEKGRRIKEVRAKQAAKKRRARRLKRALFLLFELAVFCVLLGTAYFMVQFDKVQVSSVKKDDVYVNEGVDQKQYTTIALFGGDSRKGELQAGTHADSMMIVSIDNSTKAVKIVSVYRDLVMEQMDGSLRKANNAYYVGGPQEAMEMLNKNLDLEVRDYVTVDFKAMVNVVDLLGGIEVELTEAEAEELNKHIGETASVAGKKYAPVEAGVQQLDGVQTVTYARIRKNVGDDYGRTERQRFVIEKIFEKIKDTNLLKLNSIANEVLPQVSTNLSAKQILKMAVSAGKYKIEGKSGYPFELTDGNVSGLGSSILPVDAEKNVRELHAFLYPKETYVASEEVTRITQSINAIQAY